MTTPALADPEVAAATFAAHLTRALESEHAARSGWTATWIDPLEVVVHLSAHRSDGTIDLYHLRLRAHWYDQFPPQAEFVTPPSEPGQPWRTPTTTSRWLPRIGVFADGSFAFHPEYPFATGQRQLICCSMSFDYYISGHGPTEAQRWRQGRHTVAALLARVQEALMPPVYQGPAGDHDL